MVHRIRVVSCDAQRHVRALLRPKPGRDRIFFPARTSPTSVSHLALDTTDNPFELVDEPPAARFPVRPHE